VFCVIESKDENEEVCLSVLELRPVVNQFYEPGSGCPGSVLLSHISLSVCVCIDYRQNRAIIGQFSSYPSSGSSLWTVQ